MPTTVANRHAIKPKDRTSNMRYAGRGTVLGNPYRIGFGCTREQSIALYKTYFKKRLATDPEFVKRVLEYQGAVLMCSCKPAPCHCDIIAEYLNSVEDAGNHCPRCCAEMGLAGVDIYYCPWCEYKIDIYEDEEN